ncbi:MAG: type III-A CRISPR-associated protein Cas10/Csm1 [Methanomassiliicoccales archaeon]|nr:type III-A CRISPR-associated protein Cas10/Csm1 [Methanomassiliicoccales archaeon]
MNELELRYASFLHDIGKFIQRSTINGTHQEVGSNFVKLLGSLPEGIATAVKEHHSPNDVRDAETRRMATLVQQADHLSAKERINDEHQERDPPENFSLLSPMGYITGVVHELKEPIRSWFPIEHFDASRIVEPTLENEAGRVAGALSYEKLRKQLYDDLRLLSFTLNEASFETLVNLLSTYTVFIPSATYYTIPDISLFDHLKTTCAVAEALFKGDEGEGEDKRILFIEGDISGIQDFIYSVKSPTEAQKGMASRLRGRSFVIELLNRGIAHYLLKELSLSTCSLIWCTGGHFLILAPYSEESKGKIAELKKRIDEAIFAEFANSIYVAIATVSVKASELVNFSEILSKLSIELEAEKKRRFFDVIDELSFTGKEEHGIPCAICGSFVDEKKPFCSKCDRHEAIGRSLPKSEYFLEVFFRGELDRDCNLSIPQLGIGWYLLRDIDEVSAVLMKLSGKSGRHFDIQYARLLKINDTRFVREETVSVIKSVPDIPIALGYILIGNYAPINPNGDVYSLDDVANGTIFSNSGSSDGKKGSRRLAVARLDVDNLGKIMTEGLIGSWSSQVVDPELKAIADGNRRTISRYCTISRLFDYFFKCYLNLICQNRAVFIIYSGGDDAFIVGDWIEVIKVSKEIYSRFKNFTSENDNLTLSCAISLFKYKYPIGRAGILAGELLEELPKSIEGKNAIHLFGETVNWRDSALGVTVYRDLEKLLETSDKLHDLINGRVLSKGFLYKLLKYQSITFHAEGTGCEIETASGSGRMSKSQYAEAMLRKGMATGRKKYIPYFKYEIGRLKDKLSPQDIGWLEREIPKIVPFARLPVSYISYRIREERVEKMS